MKRLLILLTLLAGLGFAASAQVFDFKLTNNTGDTITSIFVSPTASNDWENDVLSTDVLADKQTVEITFDEDYEALLLAFEVDLYDIKVIDADGDSHIWTKLKLEEITGLSLAYNKKGEAVATITKI